MGKVEFLSPEQARQLVEMAEQARAELVEFSGNQVDYKATALQLLDEWIERESSPSQKLQVLWIAFLGEMFRRRHGGEWIIRHDDGGRLAVLCPTENGGVRHIDVAMQIGRRISSGMAESLAFFYLRESAELHHPENF